MRRVHRRSDGDTPLMMGTTMTTQFAGMMAMMLKEKCDINYTSTYIILVHTLGIIFPTIIYFHVMILYFCIYFCLDLILIHSVIRFLRRKVL